MQSLDGLASAVMEYCPELSDKIHSRTTKNVIRRFLEDHGLKALLVKISAHNTSPLTEANEGDLGRLHTEIVCLEQKIEELSHDGDSSENAATTPRLEEEMAQARLKLQEIKLEYDAIKSVQEHYELVHFKIAAYICQMQGLAQVISQTSLRFIIYRPTGISGIQHIDSGS